LNTTAPTLSGGQKEFQELASLLGHELRNPLAVIIGNASFLLGRTPTAAATEPLMDIRREGERALAIINAFLEVDAAPSEPASLPAACRKIRADLMRWSPGRRIDIQVSDELPAARAMQVQVEEVLQNLVSNADKYSPSGQPIRIAISASDEALVVSVIDSGPGIPLAERQNIFRRRYRLGQHGNQAGMGLGLSVCKKLVEGWSGEIWYESQGASGSTFCFTIPRWEHDDSFDNQALMSAASQPCRLEVAGTR
jgi:two-component system sensor histidine kinase KdpD